jgi:hypothetical protein
VGRERRSIPPALRRALNARDRGCRFPSGANTRYEDAHHPPTFAAASLTRTGRFRGNALMFWQVLTDERGRLMEFSMTKAATSKSPFKLGRLHARGGSYADLRASFDALVLTILFDAALHRVVKAQPKTNLESLWDETVRRFGHGHSPVTGSWSHSRFTISS